MAASATAIPRGTPLPNYDYHCAKCKTTYETREGFDAPTTQKCQECGKGTAKRVLTAPRIVFKGSGFYATDSKSKTTAVADSDGGSSSTATESTAKSDTKGDSKTETKSETASSSKSDSPAQKSDAKPAKSAPAAATASAD
jgi:putative FmdB family regulatory protein